MYSQHYTIPLTVWQNACEAAVVFVKWSSVFFEDIVREHNVATEGKQGKTSGPVDFPSSYRNNLAEFYAVDAENVFHIWNLNKSVNVTPSNRRSMN